MYVYDITKHRLDHNGATVTDTAYSGLGVGKNNKSLCSKAGVGPIPPGLYKIGHAFTSPRTGPIAMPLTPVGHNAMGRSDFEMHGDSIEHPGQASHGCIILPRPVRLAIDAGTDKFIQVI
jgi:hypothetical protein